jgi:pimeloyl-ACP methyl ester carboxylesterase
MKTFKIFVSIALLLFWIKLKEQNSPFNVEVKGDGEPILFIPGFTCTGEVFDDVVKELSKSYQCHIFTLAGFGNVPPIEKDWLLNVKNGISNYIDSKNLKNPIVIGHSLGGTLAMWLAKTVDLNLKKIIVVDALPSIGALMIPNFDPATIVYDNPYSKTLLNMNDEEFKKMAYQSAKFMSLNEDKHEVIAKWIIMSDRKTYVNGYTDLLKLDLRDELANINVPVVILAATHPNKEMMQKNYDKQYRNLKNYEIFYAENSAHFIMYDRPEWFLTQIKKAIL